MPDLWAWVYMWDTNLQVLVQLPRDFLINSSNNMFPVSLSLRSCKIMGSVLRQIALSRPFDFVSCESLRMISMPYKLSLLYVSGLEQGMKALCRKRWSPNSAVQSGPSRIFGAGGVGVLSSRSNSAPINLP